MRVDQARVVEVWVPAVQRVGTGYLLSEALVLTSYHVVQGLAAQALVEVRPLEVPQRTTWLPARVAWPTGSVDLVANPEQDAALLVIAPGHFPPAPRGHVRFGEIIGTGPVACQGLGFPEAEARPDHGRDTMAVRGHVDPLQGRRSPMLTVHVDAGTCHGVGRAPRVGPAPRAPPYSAVRSSSVCWPLTETSLTMPGSWEPPR